MDREIYRKYLHGVVDMVVDDLPLSGPEKLYTQRFLQKIKHIEIAINDADNREHD